MFHYITLVKFHVYNKIHLIHRKNLNKSWDRVMAERRKLRVSMNQKEYYKLLKKYKINNFS